jgi:hypothetical protein
MNSWEDQNIGFHKYMISHQWLKIKATFNSCGMRALFHNIHKFPDPATGMDKTMQTGALAFVLDGIRACYQYSSHAAKESAVDLESGFPMKSIEDYIDSRPTLPLHYNTFYWAQDVDSEDEAEFLNNYDDMMPLSRNSMMLKRNLAGRRPPLRRPARRQRRRMSTMMMTATTSYILLQRCRRTRTTRRRSCPTRLHSTIVTVRTTTYPLVQSLGRRQTTRPKIATNHIADTIGPSDVEFMYCSRHEEGCGKTLKRGDVIKVDGSQPAELVKGKCWFF